MKRSDGKEKNQSRKFSLRPLKALRSQKKPAPVSPSSASEKTLSPPPESAEQKKQTHWKKYPPPITFRVTGAERQEIEAAANRAGLTVGSYVRAQCLAKPKTRAVKKPPLERELLAKLLGQVGKAGGNVHQITKRINFKEKVLRSEVESAMKELREATAAIMEAMGKAPP